MNSQIAQAMWILRDALRIGEPSRVLVIHDETFNPEACVIAEAGRQLGIESRLLLVPLSDQIRFSARTEENLPKTIRDHIDQFSKLIIFQPMDQRISKFRFDVLEYAKKFRGKQVASMPGVSLDYFQFCSGSLPDLIRSCRLHADRLLWTRKARLRTFGPDGRHYDLAFSLLDNMPRTSTGQIQLHSWGNVPSGETFIVPDLRKTEGQLYVNGSVPGHAFLDDGFLLTIESGKVLNNYDATGREYLFDMLYGKNGQEAQPNSTLVAELGLGLNPIIDCFTGLPIFDEKIAGTVHVGFGRNTQFNGPIICPLHNDFTVKGESLWLDDQLIIDRGRNILTEGDVFPNLAGISLFYFNQTRSFSPSNARQYCEVMDGTPPTPFTYLTWESDRTEGQIRTQIGSPDVSKRVTPLLWTLDNVSSDQEFVTFPDLVRAIDWLTEDELQRCLELLIRFKLIRQH